MAPPSKPRSRAQSQGQSKAQSKAQSQTQSKTQSKTVIELGGRHLTLSNLDKVMYPAAGFTKAGVIDYYARIAPVMLGHLRGRALTMVRFPNGVDGERFFEKRCPPHAPAWVRTGASTEGLEQCVVDDVATLVWVANLAALELHTLQAIVDSPGEPTALVIDLDPGPPAGIRECCAVALTLRDMIERLGLTARVKTSGSKGLHLMVPVEGVDAEETKSFALALGQLLAKDQPERVTVAMAREQRAGRVFVDWSQNDRHKTTVSAYSLRAQPRPTVSTPLRWDEVSDALDGNDDDPLAFEAADVLARVSDGTDLYAADPGQHHALPKLA